MGPDRKVIDKWSASAAFWEKHRDAIRGMFAPVARALVEDAQISSGNAVLDVATGPGDPALSIAATVGPEGSVSGIDPVPEMVEAARRAAVRLGLVNSRFEVAFADRLPFPSETFDAVVSRFGAMFFPSPVNAGREMLRVLKPGKILALAVWHSAEGNPFLTTLSRAMEPYVKSPPPDPDAPEVYRFATSGKLRDVLAEAGAVETKERLLRFRIETPLATEEFWTLRCEISDTYREKLALLSSEQLAEVKRNAFEALRAYETGNGLSFPAEVLIVSGTRRR
jgi:enediyne biosynthesis protein CalE5